ncbi:MAG TPA: GHKL domain-containing protein [Bacteroides sp.]|nr:GHKL domain-containing protein [Bacteroides sp.]
MRTGTLTYLLFLVFYFMQDSCAQNPPVAVRGEMDLRGYNFMSDGPVELRGEFEFYWDRMLNPAVEGDSGEMIYVSVPGTWNRLRKEHPEVTRYGFATYRLIIRLPENVDAVAFRIDEVYSASAYFLNGKAFKYLGFPGVNKYQSVMEFREPLVTSSVNDSRLELLVRVSNFEHRLSGIVGGLTMGLPEQMQTLRQKELFRGHFLMGAFLIVGIYFLGLYLIRSEDYRLHFSMLCLLMVFRILVIHEPPVIESLNINGLTSARLDLLNIYFFAPFFILMIRALFPIEFPEKVFRPLIWTAVLFIALVVVTPISLFSYSLPYFFGYFILVSALFLYVVILAWIRGRSHAPVFAIGLFILFVGTLNDMLNEIELLDTPYIFQYAMFVYLVIYAFIFADKSNRLQVKSMRLAQEVDQIRNNLEELVEERTTALQSVSKQLEKQKKKLEASNRELVDAMNARNRLFAIIGHDVRAPIGYIKQALEMIMENKDMSVREREELLRMVTSSSSITYNLLDNLLVWGRSQTGKLKANPVKFKLKPLIDESLELVSIGIREKKLKVEVYVSEEHFVEADRDQMYVVIRNLLSNAIKFTPDKGHIYISSKRQKGEVLISIRDTGIGIPDVIKNKLLGEEAYVSTRGTQGERGSGLGLKICNEIIQSNYGWMKIESESGTGSTVIVGIKSGRK